MNKQEMFNKVKERLLDGKGQATFPCGSCSYENDDGLRCAAGVLFEGQIPKKINVIGVSIEGLATNTDTEHLVPDYIKENIYLVKSLQAAHDCLEFWDGKIFNKIGIIRLKFLAEFFKLEYGDE